LFTSNIYSNVYAAYYKFINDEFNIGAEISVMLNSWSDLYEKSNVYSAIFSELLCVVSKYPKKIHKTMDNNLHNLSGSAVEWGALTELTKWNNYFVNGRNVPEKEYSQAIGGQITKQDWLGQKNEDIKAAWFEILGGEKIMTILEAKEIDSKVVVHSNGEAEDLRLYKTDFVLEEIGEKLAWVKFICPSTGASYLISVNPKFDMVMDAVLYTCPFYGEEIKNEKDYNFNARG
jgi:hypothetical protein